MSLESCSLPSAAPVWQLKGCGPQDPTVPNDSALWATYIDSHSPLHGPQVVQWQPAPQHLPEADSCSGRPLARKWEQHGLQGSRSGGHQTQGLTPHSKHAGSKVIRGDGAHATGMAPGANEGHRLGGVVTGSRENAVQKPDPGVPTWLRCHTLALN